MRIPASSTCLTTPSDGQKVTAKSDQYGPITLITDGKIDDDFVKATGSKSTWVDLRDPRLEPIFKADARIYSASAGLKDRQTSEFQRVLSQVAEGANLRAYFRTTTSPDNRLLSTTVRLSNMLDGDEEILTLRHTDDKVTEVTLKATSGLVEQTITAQLSPQGELQSETIREQLALETPWLRPGSLPKSNSSDFFEMADPRLERVAEAAEGGVPLGAFELGPEWKFVDSQGTVQNFSSSNQKLQIDSADLSFKLSSHLLHQAPSYSDYGDTLVESTLKWKSGKFVTE